MTDEIDDEYFRELIGHIDDHPEWDFTGNGEGEESLENHIKQSAEAMDTGGLIQYFFDHAETDGRLVLNAPNPQRDQALQGSLGQALEQRQKWNPETDPFLEKLTEAHGAISDRYDDEYLNPVADPVTIIGIEVPFDYDPDTLENALYSISDASKEVDQLHDEMIETLESYI